MGSKGRAIGFIFGVFVLTISHLYYNSTYPSRHAPTLGDYHLVAVDSLFFGAFLFVFLWLGRQYDKAQKKTDRRLQAAQQELRDVLRYQQGVTFKYKKEGSAFIHTLCDGELCYQTADFHPDRIVGRTLEECLPPDLARFAEPFYNQAWESGEVVTYEMNCSGKTYFHILRPMLLNGEVTEVIGLAADITAAKETERELRQTKELLESIISSTTDAIHVIDTEGCIVQVNEAFERVYGWSHEEMLGKGLIMIPSNLYEKVTGLYEKVRNYLIPILQTIISLLES